MAVRFALPHTVRLPVRRAVRDGKARLHRWWRMLDRPVASADRGNVLPFRGRTEHFRQFCQDCRDDTLHAGFTEIGLGWCAQIFRCCRCGRQSMKLWSWW